MIISWVRTMLGPLSAILDWFSAHPGLITGILVVWLVLYVAGRIQLSRIRQRSAALVVAQSQHELAFDPSISLAVLRDRLLAQWQAEYAGWRFWFVPHKYEFWPVKATPRNVLVKMPFSPEWLHEVLTKAGVAHPEPPPPLAGPARPAAVPPKAKDPKRTNVKRKT